MAANTYPRATWVLGSLRSSDRPSEVGLSFTPEDQEAEARRAGMRTEPGKTHGGPCQYTALPLVADTGHQQIQRYLERGTWDASLMR